MLACLMWMTTVLMTSCMQQEFDPSVQTKSNVQNCYSIDCLFIIITSVRLSRKHIIEKSLECEVR